MLKIVPFACAEFHDKSGAVIHTIRPADLRVFSEVPEAIRQDPLFDMMLRDGSLQIAETKKDQKRLENDPKPKAPVKKAPTMKAQEPAEEKGSAAPIEAAENK